MAAALGLLTLLLAAASPRDTVAYADAATRALVARARDRRAVVDTAVQGYEAALRYRLTVALARRRWSRPPPAAVEEQQARVTWRLPNDLRVDIVGRRTRNDLLGISLASIFDYPWFVPRGVDDSVRVFASDFPATGAPHPFAAGAEQWYAYRIVDSAAVRRGDGARLRLYAVQVTPRRRAPALIAGRLWVDSATAEVARMTFRYVGTGLYAAPDAPTARDSSRAARRNRRAARILTLDLDLEYGIQEGRFWMPERQTIAGTIQLPLAGDLTIPFEAVTTFRDYEINAAAPIAFTRPDLARARSVTERNRARREARERAQEADAAPRDTTGGAVTFGDVWRDGRYEIVRPSNDSLRRFRGWSDSLVPRAPGDDPDTREARAELARLAEELPDDLTGRPGSGVAWERGVDVLGYNRVQGVSLGLGWRQRLPVPFTALYGTARYGLSDERVTGRLAARHDGPAGRFTLAGWHDVQDVDPLSPGRTIGNSLNALLTAHDYADYTLATGGGVTAELDAGPGRELVLGVRVERQRSVATEARSGVNDLFGGSGFFLPNAPVTEGTFAGASARLSGAGPFRWAITGDLLAGAGTAVGRLWAEGSRTLGGPGWVTLRARAGVATGSELLQQQWRIGGLRTVRGFDYGASRGSAFWHAQLDLTPLAWPIRPVAFVDAGRAASPGALFDRVQVGAGAGLALYIRALRGEAVRAIVSRPVSERGGWRVDLVFGR